MNRPKIFLGVTTCLLAMAGIAATKYFNPQKIFGYYTRTTGIAPLGLCTVQRTTPSYFTLISASTSSAKAKSAGTNHTLWSQPYTQGHCNVRPGGNSPLYTAPKAE